MEKSVDLEKADGAGTAPRPGAKGIQAALAVAASLEESPS